MTTTDLLLKLAMAYGDAQFALGDWNQPGSQLYDDLEQKVNDAWTAFAAALKATQEAA